MGISGLFPLFPTPKSPIFAPERWHRTGIEVMEAGFHTRRGQSWSIGGAGMLSLGP